MKKLKKGRLIIVLFLYSLTLTGQNIVENTIKMAPREVIGEKVYILKYAPMQINNVPDSIFSQFMEGYDSIWQMERFNEFLEEYNNTLYRELNVGIEKEIRRLKRECLFVPIFKRDFEEKRDTSIRYVIKPNYSIDSLNYRSSHSSLTELSVKFCDLKNDVEYVESLGLREVMGVIHYVNKLSDNGKLNELSNSELERKILRRCYNGYSKVDPTIRHIFVAAIVTTGISTIVATVIGGYYVLDEIGFF